MKRKLIDLTGKKFGRLTVIERAPNDKHNHTVWRCMCECGKERRVDAQSLREGITLSCGCYHRDSMIKRQTKHGLSGTSEYFAWQNMVRRCTNPNHKQAKDYIIRGIKVCDRWRGSYENFITDMGSKPSPHHSIDRIDCDGNYEPSNCQWATKAVQYKNRRVRLLHEFTDRQIADEYRKRFLPPPETVYGFNYAY